MSLIAPLVDSLSKINNDSNELYLRKLPTNQLVTENSNKLTPILIYSIFQLNILETFLIYEDSFPGASDRFGCFALYPNCRTCKKYVCTEFWLCYPLRKAILKQL